MYLTISGTAKPKWCSERRNRTLFDMVWSMIAQKILLGLVETYILNRVPFNSLSHTIYELWTDVNFKYEKFVPLGLFQIS